MGFGAINWLLLTGIGVALLLGAIAIAKLRNRSTPAEIQRTERATHDVYEEEERAHRGEDDDVV